MIFLLFGVVIVEVKILILFIVFVVLLVFMKLLDLNGLKISNIMLVVKFFSEFCKDKLIVKLVVFNIVINDVVFMFSWFNEVMMMKSIKIVFIMVFKKLINIVLYLDFVIIWWKIERINLIIILLMI